MKVLIVIDSLGTGGAERSTAVMANFLMQENIEFEIFCLDEKAIGVQEKMRNVGFPISFLKHRNFFLQVKELVDLIKLRKFDLVHSILFRANLRTRFAKNFTNFKHLESLVNTTYSKERFLDTRVNKSALQFYKLIDRLSAPRKVDHFHSITHAVKEHYVEEINLEPEKITVIPRGRPPIIKSHEDRPSNNTKVVQLINVGRHEFQKGQIFLLEAINILRKKGYNFHLKILGREGSVTPELKKYILQENLEKVVTLEGYTHNVPEYLLNSDIFVFPSLYEGLGGALIEAQAAGLPIACNNICVLHEVVRENVNARFFDVHQKESIVEAIRFYLDRPTEMQNYGAASLQNFQDNFLESVNNKKMLDLYAKLAEK